MRNRLTEFIECQRNSCRIPQRRERAGHVRRESFGEIPRSSVLPRLSEGNNRLSESGRVAAVERRDTELVGLLLRVERGRKHERASSNSLCVVGVLKAGWLDSLLFDW